VLDNVSFGLSARAFRVESDTRAHRWIARVGLDVALTTISTRTSFGRDANVAIARTLILHPRIILMDEPFGALDPMTRMTMQDLVLELWRTTQATVFFVTHSIEEAVFLGDRIYVLSNSPGTILHELTIEPSDRPSKEMQREERFQQTVYYLRDLISRLEESRRAGT
jgi:NitT/TauT family transport system ATP-binding protein